MEPKRLSRPVLMCDHLSLSLNFTINANNANKSKRTILPRHYPTLLTLLQPYGLLTVLKHTKQDPLPGSLVALALL